MILRPLGINGLYPTNDSGTSGYLIKGEKTNIVLDFGSGVFKELYNQTSIENIDCIVISHFHFDHVSDMGVLSYYLERLNKTINVFVPKDDCYLYKALFLNKKCFNVIFIEENIKYNVGEFTLKFVKVKHPLLTYGVVLSDDKKTIAYTGDSNVCDNLDILFSGVDLAICDSAFLSCEGGENKPHMTAVDCAKYSKKYGFKLLLSHLNPKTDKNALLKEAQTIDKNAQIIELKDYII